MIFNVYGGQEMKETLIDVAGLSNDSALFIKRSRGFFGISRARLFRYKVPWTEINIYYDTDTNRQIVSYLRYRNDNNEILHYYHVHKTDRSDIPKYFTLTTKLNYFMTNLMMMVLYSNYFKLIIFD